MRCARCGSTLERDAKVCGQCGAVVGASYGASGGKSPFAPKAPSLPAARLGETPRLLGRVKSILRSPRAEWPVIAAEPTTPTEIYTGYAIPLAAIGAVALFVAQVAVGVPVPLIGLVKAPLAAGLASGLLLFALALVNLYLMAWIVDALAPRFGGEPDRLRALKLAAYSYTPIWLAGVLYLLPRLWVLWLAAALYALYLALVGLPHVMRCRPERAVAYALLAGACALALGVVFAALVTALIGVGPGLFD
jgi:hypothetical protein